MTVARTIMVMNVVEIYEQGDEAGRLTHPRNQVEWLRTCELLHRWLPPAPARIADVGSGPGAYASHLSDAGYTVTAFDLVPKHVEQARRLGLDARQADARDLPLPDACMQATLILGPGYHLPDAADRARVFGEAHRVTVAGGVIVVAALSRHARVFVRAAAGDLADPAWHRHTLTSIADGHVADGDDWDLSVSWN